ncbi:MAG: hypothetical protein GC161_08830 [Planctomycetaceae bacterium]|nr:hypothetical protein [Planctomycetaceae bacterium]
METRLEFAILPQPDDETCGPTCLQAVYAYYGDRRPLPEVIGEITPLEHGGTLAVLLANHALRTGRYDAHIHTFNLQVFDPSWFESSREHMRARLEAQATITRNPKKRLASKAYLEFLDHGGVVEFSDLTSGLLRKYLKRDQPILTGLSATFLYRCQRELGSPMHFDDVKGDPQGHFVVLCGHDSPSRKVLVADPLHTNPISKSHFYEVDIDRLLNAILLGILTYDANLLILTPKRS